MSTDSPPLVTSEPYILGEDDSAQLSAELAQYARDIELEAKRKQEEDRRAAKQKLEDEERERQEAIERAKEDVLFAETLAVVVKEKRSEAGKKGWQTQLRNGRVTATMLKAEAKEAAIKRLQDEGRFVSKEKKERGVLEFRSSTDATRQNRLRELGYQGHGFRSENSEAGPSRSIKSVQPDRSCRKEDPENEGRPRSDTKSLKRTRSSVSDGAQIIPSSRDDYDTPPSRLVLDPPLHRSSHRRPRDRDDQRPRIPRHVERDRDHPTRTKTGLRRTDHPANYGLPEARYPRQRDQGRDQESGRSNRRNLRRIDNLGDRNLPRPGSRNDGDREREDRDARQGREARDARERREERESRKRREAREKLEREEIERRAEEEEERNLGPMKEQIRAHEERAYQRSVKNEQVKRQEERRRLRLVQGTERHPIVVPDRAVKREDYVNRPVGRGSRLSVRGAVIDMTEFSD